VIDLQDKLSTGTLAKRCLSHHHNKNVWTKPDVGNLRSAKFFSWFDKTWNL